MAEFSATDAAFEGFRLTREQPAAIGVWSAFTLVVSLVTTVLMIVMAGPQLAAMQAADPQAAQSPDAVLAQFGAIAPAYLFVLLISLAAYSVLYAALYRAMLRPSEGGLGFIRFGADEMRTLLALLAVFGILFGAYMALGLVAGIAIGIAAVAAGAGGQGAAAAVTGLIVLLVLVGMLAGLVFLAVRLSLVLPASFDRRRVVIGEAWRMTKGRFWPLLGAFMLAFVLTLAVYLLATVVFVAIAAIIGGGMEAAGQVFSADFSSVGAYFTPLVLIYTVFAAVIGALGFAILGGAAGAAYRDLSGAREQDVFA